MHNFALGLLLNFWQLSTGYSLGMDVAPIAQRTTPHEEKMSKVLQDGPSARHLRLLLLTLITQAAFVYVAQSALAQEILDPGAASEVYIDSINYTGNGCPAGSVASNISPEAQAFTLMYDSFIADGSSAQNRQRGCGIGMRIHVPSGWTVGVMSLDHRGYADIPQGGRATQNTAYRFGPG
jgi:hypothetical protein